MLQIGPNACRYPNTASLENEPSLQRMARQNSVCRTVRGQLSFAKPKLVALNW